MDDIIESLRGKIEAAQKAAKAQLVAQKITSDKKKGDEGLMLFWVFSGKFHDFVIFVRLSLLYFQTLTEKKIVNGGEKVGVDHAPDPDQEVLKSGFSYKSFLAFNE
ncbi:unnamed protein product [Strongylus vulgaris]|uniref:Uncharacterized protein n=1 Tax=Strongylus vulgaris TaxID=40348 RepID=A0A3P7JXQ6_STRVU|nr:unnamed protein product [Strongylus vulgaris]